MNKMQGPNKPQGLRQRIDSRPYDCVLVSRSTATPDDFRHRRLEPRDRQIDAAPFGIDRLSASVRACFRASRSHARAAETYACRSPPPSSATDAAVSRRRIPLRSRRCRCIGPSTMISTCIRCRRKMGAALRRRRGLAGGALLGRRRLRLQAQDHLERRTADLCRSALCGARRRRRSGSIPFKVRDGILSIIASRTPPALKARAVQQ